MDLSACPSCNCHVMNDPCRCPHCGVTLKTCGPRLNKTGVAVLMSLAAVGCNGKDGGSDTWYASEYGVFDTSYLMDQDDDGFSPEDGDCDDYDDTVYPGAEETPGDGVDSNCNNEDDS